MRGPKVVAAAVLVVAMALGLTSCAEWDVLRNRAKNQVQEMIGKLDVQRQEVVNQIAEAEKEIERVQRVEAESRVQAEMLATKLEELKAAHEESRQALLRLADVIESGEPVTLADGRELTEAELADYAEMKQAQFESEAEKIASFEETLSVYESTANEAHQRWTEGEASIERLNAGLELLDARVLELNALTASGSTGTSDDAWGDQIAEAEKLLEDTTADVESQSAVIRELRDMEGATGISEEAIEDALTSSSDLAESLRTTAGE